MLHAILRQCRQMSMRSVWPRFTSFAREMPANADAVCFARQRFISHTREMPTDVDAVCTHARTMLPVRLRGKGYCFTSFAREMPTNRRCCLLYATTLHLLREGNADESSMPAQPMRSLWPCGLCGHAIFAPCRLCGYAVFVAMRSLWPCGYWGYAVLTVMQSFVSCGLRDHAGSADAAF